MRLIVNPTSGRGRGAKVAEQVSRILNARGVVHELCASATPDEPTKLAQAAVKDGCPCVVAIGGDGLVHQVANVLVGTETTLGIIPAGIGNDFVRGLRLPLEIDKAVEVIVDGVDQRVDVGQANDRYFLSVAVIGLAAEINRRANQFKRLRVSALYTALTVISVFLDRPVRFTIQYDGQIRQCFSWLVAIGNTWSSARGMALVPAARADDGILDACIVNGMGKIELLYTFPRVFAGRHIYSTGIDSIRGRELTVSAASPCSVFADGEYVGPLPMTLRAVPRALQVRMPKVRQR
ncbi:MAG: diacylglycerol kinase family lipid kinase [Deltaproteobacteria bacterium]|nr:diacylglycerol kinase family lipid kinase [Deltaproteobacteria bacterium]